MSPLSESFRKRNTKKHLPRNQTISSRYHYSDKPRCFWANWYTHGTHEDAKWKKIQNAFLQIL